jgi:glutathione S-transferase
MLTLYDNHDSGNGYKVRLMLALLGIEYTYMEIDSINGETRKGPFLAKNPNGRIPVLELDDGTFLPESNAILHYLADGTSFVPTDRLDHAQTLQWMFFEQYTHEPSVAVARFIMRHLAPDHERHATLPAIREQGHAALAVMEDHLKDNDWFAANRPTIADVSLFAYTHMAEDGGIELSNYGAINAWLERVRGVPAFVALEDT